ncbi:hypothetical protein RSOL_363340, partial [Rhizoctonia solani AG-3 Rhs1AP]
MLSIAPSFDQPTASPIPSPGVPPTTEKPSSTSASKKKKKKASTAAAKTAQQTKEARSTAIENIIEACNTVPPTMQPPTPKPATSARSDARDLWWFLLPLEKRVQISWEVVEALIQQARKFQEDVVFDSLQHPEEKELLCIPCLFKGIIKYYHNQTGGITGRICEHMEKYHPVPYYTKCLQEGLKHRCKNISIDAINGGQPEFTFSGFLS